MSQNFETAGTYVTAYYARSHIILCDKYCLATYVIIFTRKTDSATKNYFLSYSCLLGCPNIIWILKRILGATRGLKDACT